MKAKKVCLDTGVLNLLLLQSPSREIKDLHLRIKSGQTIFFTLRPLLLETYTHFCKKKGKEVADKVYAYILKSLNLRIVDLSDKIIIKAGKLKC